MSVTETDTTAEDTASDAEFDEAFEKYAADFGGASAADDGASLSDDRDLDADDGAGTDPQNEDGDPDLGSDRSTATTDGGADDDAQPDPDSDAADDDTDGEPDPWAAVPADLRPKITELEKNARTLDSRVRGLDRRNGQLASENSRLKQEIAALKNPQPGGKTGGDGKDGAGSAAKDAEWEQTVEDYPDLAGPVGRKIDALTQQIASQQEMLDGMTAERRGHQIQENGQTVLEAHSDFATVVQSPEFWEWAGSLPQKVQDIIADNAEGIVDPESTIWVVDRFKQSKAQSPGTTTAGAAADGQAPNGGTGPNPAGKRGRQRDASVSGASTPASSRVSDGPGANASEAEHFEHYAKLAAQGLL